MSYTIHEHVHRFAVWTAGTAARTKGNRFKVKHAKQILEAAGFDARFLAKNPPKPSVIDREHDKWRDEVIKAAGQCGFKFTHGIAAKLINVYFKTAFVTMRGTGDPSVDSLHPPFDSLLLKGLKKADRDAKRKKQWASLAKKGWSKWDADDYRRAVELGRQERANQPFWTIEEHWRGYQ